MSKQLFEQIQEELTNTRNQVLEGELSNLDGFIRMRKAKDEAEKVLETIKSFENDRLNEIANEASEHPKDYHGFKVTLTSGRKMFSFKGIPDYEEIESKRKQLEEQYKNAFEGFQKGTVQTVVEDNVRYWIDADGSMRLFPEFNIGKSFLTVKNGK